MVDTTPLRGSFWPLKGSQRYPWKALFQLFKGAKITLWNSFNPLKRLFWLLFGVIFTFQLAVAFVLGVVFTPLKGNYAL